MPTALPATAFEQPESSAAALASRGAVRWLPLAVLGALPLFVLRAGAQPISDPDTFWHVLMGRALWQNWQFFGPDPLRGMAVLPYVNHQSLPELGMAAADHVLGLAGVAWFAAAMYAALLVAVYAAARSRGSVLPATLATILCLVGMSGSVSPRPQVIGFTLLAVTVGAWMRTRSDGRIRWWLLPLTWVWACSHGTWLLGPALAVLFALGLSLDRRIDRRALLRAVLLAALSLLAGGLTPVGPRLLLTPFSIRDVSPFIAEWRPAALTESSLIACVATLVVVALVWSRSARRISMTDLLLWAVALASAVLYARTIAVGAILATPLLAGALQSVLPIRTASRGAEWRILAVATAVVLVVVGLVVPRTASAAGGVPARLDATLARMPEGTVVYNVDALGGWLWYAHPNVKPTMDTRAEMYGPQYVGAYVDAISGHPGWQETVSRTGARYALLAADGPLSDALVHQGGWTVVGTDAGYQLLEAP
jgi:hypothetical protein